jgi:hypothetical protein
MSYRGLGAYDASYFDTLAPGSWTAAGVDPNATASGATWNPTLSTDPAHIAAVNQMLANGTNPVTGQPTSLNRAALGKGYRWQGGGDLVNPYTQQSVGNAFALGAAGIAALPEAFNFQAAWEALDAYATAKGYSLGADGSVRDNATYQIIGHIPSINDIARGGRATAEAAQQQLASLKPSAVAQTTAPVAPPSLPPTPPPVIVAPPPPAPTGRPAGWRYNGENGWWGPDGLFYKGTATSTPWSDGTKGVSVETFKTPTPPTNSTPTTETPPGTPTATAPAPTSTPVEMPATPVTPPPTVFVPSGPPIEQFGPGPDQPPADGTPVQAAGLGVSPTAIVIGLGLVGALWYASRKR